MGLESSLDVEKGQATVRKGTAVLALELDKTTARLNDKDIQLDAAPTIIDDALYVPLSMFWRHLDLKVIWDGKETFAYILGCSQKLPPNPAFIVVPGAQELHHHHSYGVDQIYYRLEEAYPADTLLKEIKNRLQELGWEPLEEAYLNPGLPSSHVRGWTTFGDSTRGATVTVKQWLADWTNQEGDVLQYALRYSSSPNGSMDTDTVEVFGIFTPADIAQQMKEFARQVMEKQDEAESSGHEPGHDGEEQVPGRHEQ